MTWFRSWLDAVAPAGRPVLLVGFSGGAAFAGGLLLSDPGRDAGGRGISGAALGALREWLPSMARKAHRQ